MGHHSPCTLCLSESTLRYSTELSSIEDFLNLESLVLSSPKTPSGAVEKYFDNLVTMIEDAAEGL